MDYILLCSKLQQLFFEKWKQNNHKSIRLSPTESEFLWIQKTIQGQRHRQKQKDKIQNNHNHNHETEQNRTEQNRNKVNQDKTLNSNRCSGYIKEKKQIQTQVDQ